MNPVSFEKRRGPVAYYAQITASMTAPASGFFRKRPSSLGEKAKAKREDASVEGRAMISQWGVHLNPRK